MPQASAALCKKWGCKNGEEKALSFLFSKGWKQIANGMMQPPEPIISYKESEALQYLIDEWDFACETVLIVKPPRGFAAMSEEKRQETAKLGGASVPAHRRTFSNRKLAVKAAMRGGRSVAKEKRTYYRDNEIARAASRESQRKRKEKLHDQQVDQDVNT